MYLMRVMLRPSNGTCSAPRIWPPVLRCARRTASDMERRCCMRGSIARASAPGLRYTGPPGRCAPCGAAACGCTGIALATGSCAAAAMDGSGLGTQAQRRNNGDVDLILADWLHRPAVGHGTIRISAGWDVRYDAVNPV